MWVANLFNKSPLSKDDLQHLEHEYDRLKEPAQLTEVENDFWTENTGGDAIGRLMHEAEKLQDCSKKKVRRDLHER